jgi:hypothetical protein
VRIDPLRTYMARTISVAVALAVAASGALWAGDAAAGLAAIDVAPAKAYGPDFTLPNRPDLDADSAITEYDLSLGCIVGGVTGTGLSVGAGGLNVINLIAGGIVPASNPIAAYLALGGVVFASFCAVGQALTPTVMATYRYFLVPRSVTSPSQSEARYCQAEVPPRVPRAGPGLDIGFRRP